MKLLSYVLSAAVVCSGLYAATSQREAHAASSPSASSAATATPHSVDIKNFSYVPATISVGAGSTVVFTNRDDTAHTASSDDKSFDSANMDAGQTWSHVFTKAGTYTYYCAYHTYMHGTVIVTGGSTQRTTGKPT